jgi:hypothetical protein
MESINFNTLGNGAVAERFDLELKKVLENIADVNADFKKVRKLQITISMKPNESRDIASVQIMVKPTLAPAKETNTSIVLGYDKNGEIAGAELQSGAKGQTFIDVDGDVASDTGEKLPTSESKVLKFK